MKKHLKKHKYKIVVAIPLIATFLAGTNLIGQELNTLTLIPDNTAFITQQEDISLTLQVKSSEEINVISSLITYPKDILTVKEITYDDTVIDLWVQKPTLLSDFNMISFSGGIITKDKGFTGTSTVLNIIFTPIKTGLAPVNLEGSVLLAHDGSGDNIITGVNNLTVYIREDSIPSPDVNNDGVLSLKDISIVYTHTLFNYDFKYDINGDGKVSMSDVTNLFSMIN